MNRIPLVLFLLLRCCNWAFAGLDPVNGDPRGYLNNTISKNYSALLNDSIQNQLFHGSALPLYSGFLFNNISWKGFSFSFNITYRLDYYFRQSTIDYSSLINNMTGHSDYALRWQKPGDEQYTNVPSFVYPANSDRDRFYAYSEVNVKRADNIRLQDMRLAYNWQNSNTAIPVKGAQVFLYANNLNVILWKKEKSSYDPDYFDGVPTPKLWTAGINFNF